MRDAVIHPGPLPPELISPAALAAPEHGAVATFLGVVRNNSRGAGVSALDYECYRPMAEKMLRDLIEETADRFDRELSASVAHGIGHMVPGDVSVSIHVASAHRAAAFDACRHLIERIKQDLPVWKREHYTDGSSVWLKGS